MKTSIFRAAGSVAGVASCLVLFSGVASADSINDSGRGSRNIISHENICTTKVHNNTDITFINDTWQDADSGDTTVKNNDDVNGSISSGSASNLNHTSFNTSVTNASGAGCGAEQPVKAPGENIGGGHGGGQTLGISTSAPAPGRGVEEREILSTSVVEQVATVPVGGVGAGSGGTEYLGGLVAVTLLSGALATRRLQRSFRV